jgi:hypothetical protein
MNSVMHISTDSTAIIHEVKLQSFGPATAPCCSYAHRLPATGANPGLRELICSLKSLPSFFYCLGLELLNPDVEVLMLVFIILECTNIRLGMKLYTLQSGAIRSNLGSHLRFAALSEVLGPDVIHIDQGVCFITGDLPICHFVSGVKANSR